MLGSENGVDLHLSIYSVAVQGKEREEGKQELPAQLFHKGNASYIRYVEDLEGIGRVTTTLKVEEKQVTIIRHGALRMNHAYRVGEETISQYITGQGSLEMKTETIRLEYTPFRLTGQVSSLGGLNSSHQGKLHLCYHLSLQGEYVGQFTLELNMQARQSR